jgi:ketosteroid isomerase-like protein
MDAPDNKAIVRAFLAAAAVNDRERMGQFLDPRIRVIEAASLPFGGEHVGIEAFHALTRRVFRLWRDTRVEVHEMLADGDRVVVLATMHGRSRDGVRTLEMPIAEIWRLESGKVSEIRPFYFDTRGFLDTLGTGTA